MLISSIPPERNTFLLAAAAVSAAVALFPTGTVAQAPVTQQLLQDSLTPIELVHEFLAEWPTGITVSASGRRFANYPRSDQNNVAYTVAELRGNSTETAFPSARMNLPAGGVAVMDNTTGTMVASGDANALVSVQSVVLDPMDRLWILDTGRPTVNATMLLSQPGGPKLVGVDISTNEVIKTIALPPTVAFPDSYLNDVRFDLRANLTDVSGGGVAYITDSSNEGRNGIIVVDLGTGEAWRKLDGHESVRPESGFLPFIHGLPWYVHATPDAPLTYSTTGSDGIAIAADGERLFYSPLSSRRLYSVSTAALRARGVNKALRAEDTVVDLGQKGMSDGLETDAEGNIYTSDLELGGINIFSPVNGTVSPFVASPDIQWPDTLSVSDDGFIYFTSNQYNLQPTYHGGTDLRQRPFGLFRAQAQGGRVKLM